MTLHPLNWKTSRTACLCVCFPAWAVHQQGVCICAEPELQLGLVAHVSLPAHLCTRNTCGKKETVERANGVGFSSVTFHFAEGLNLQFLIWCCKLILSWSVANFVFFVINRVKTKEKGLLWIEKMHDYVFLMSDLKLLDLKRQLNLAFDQKSAKLFCSVTFFLCYSSNSLLYRKLNCCAGDEQKDPQTAGQEQDVSCGLWSCHLHLLW